ncbi:hypothetical protein ACEQ8H_004594 [Pleosporales sp. CAS-2024a]
MKDSNKRVAVIGAGISGVVAAAHLKREGIQVTVFERSKAAGGVWLFDEKKPPEPSYAAVPVSQAGVVSTANHDTNTDAIRRAHAPPGPCYVGLQNNVSTRLLETTLNRFPLGTPDFVSHTVLRAYIQDTAMVAGVDAVTRYNTLVKSVVKKDSLWTITATTLHAADNGACLWTTTDCYNFDAVVVASGHYHAPRVPDTRGLADWKRLWPSRVEHSKSYRHPRDYYPHGKKFLLVGASVSSTDIARELGPYANRIYQSQRQGTFDLPAGLLPENGYRVDEVLSYNVLPSALVESTSISLDASSEAAIPGTVTLKNGQTLCDIHHVILCTGYHMTLPFLQPLHADSTVPADLADEKVLVTDGTQFHNLHKDMFYMSDPSLAFVGVPFFTATFSLCEFQAMVVAKVFAGQAELPSEHLMRAEYKQRVASKGHGKPFHSLRHAEEDYVQELLAWVNHHLDMSGRTRLVGHTEQWHTAKAAQVQRMRHLLQSAASSPEKSFLISCLP